jgi:hypothetical protein
MSYKEYTVKVYADGSNFWFLNGKCHREDGPAIEYADGSKLWSLNGKYHREDGPACEWADGSKSWYQNDKLHREDGPACEYSDGTKFWYLNGKECTEAEFLKKTSKVKELTVAELEKLLGYSVKIVKE